VVLPEPPNLGPLVREERQEGVTEKPKDTAKYTCPLCREKTRIKLVHSNWIVQKHLNERGSTCPFSGAEL